MTRRDSVFVVDFACPARIGWTAEERAAAQELMIDIEVFLDADECARSSRLEDTINYSDVRQLACEIAGQREWVLVEALCLEIIRQTVRTFPLALGCRTRIRKKRDSYWIGAELERTRKELS